MPRTIAERTRRVYDHLSAVYPASTFFFHSKAHACAMRHLGIENGMQVLEIATGSGEMFRRLVRANPDGKTFGLDLSPNMAARTQRRARQEFPSAEAHCGAVDVRSMPFRTGSFDAVVCCYLLELLGPEDIALTLREIARVLRPGGRFSLVVIGQNAKVFNRLYRVVGSLVPAFWGRQIEESVANLLGKASLKIVADELVRQSGYPSRVLIARK
jgi:ubiquinone/menaquinone biosynthesis C-methylase UbiE